MKETESTWFRVRKFQWDLKTILLILSFCGVTTLTTLVSCGRDIAGEVVLPTIRRETAKSSLKSDSAIKIAVDSVNARIDAKYEKIGDRFDLIEDYLMQVPQIKKYAEEKGVRDHKKGKYFHHGSLRAEGD